MSIYPQGESHQKVFEQLHEASEEIASLKIVVDTFQKMNPQDFLALWNAKCLLSGIHHGAARAPGRTDPETLNRLRNHGWIEPSDRAGFWILTEAGRLLIGEADESEDSDATLACGLASL